TCRPPRTLPRFPYTTLFRSGLGEPVFDILHAELAKAVMSINACKGFEIGSGFDGGRMNGSDHNDKFYTTPDGQVRTETNNSGGTQGGISNGMPIYARAAFEPVATVLRPEDTTHDTRARRADE